MWLMPPLAMVVPVIVVATITGFQLAMFDAKITISFSLQLPDYLGVATVFIKSRLLAILLLKPR